MGFETPQVDDLVEDLVSAFREGLVHFIEELDAKLQQPGVQELETSVRFEFQSLEQKEGQLRIASWLTFLLAKCYSQERQALDELRKALREAGQRFLESRW